MLFANLLLFSFCSVVISTTRQLYIDNTDLARVYVSTSYRGLNFAYGVVAGNYQGKSGLFISAFKPPAVYFMDTSNGCEATKTCTLIQIIGNGVAGIDNGVRTGGSGTVASISDPSRMAYAPSLRSAGVLFVMDRTNGLIRYMDLGAGTIGTLTAGSQLIQIYGSKLPDNNPELDIKISGDYLYVSDSSWVYNITGADGTLSGMLSNAVIRPYHSLKAWQINNGYEYSQKVYLTSIAVNAPSNLIYVSYTYRRHAIVVLPMHGGPSSGITILVSDNILYNPVQMVPIPINGNIADAIVNTGSPTVYHSYVTFPMHMHYDVETNGIYFVEVFAHFSSGTVLGALGSVAVRRLLLSTGEIDYIAGYGSDADFRDIYGKRTGYVDGYDSVAEFSYPVSIAFIGASVSGNGGLRAYVVDSQNSAIRKIESIVATPFPTAAPSISMAPTTPTLSPTTAFPSRMPTRSPTTHPPTAVPTLSPTLSQSPTLYVAPTSQPTELNGECLIVTVWDTFGDGWGGAQLRIETPGHASRALFFESTDSSPQTYSICSSYVRPDEFGLYNAMVIVPEGTTNVHEIRWSVTIEETRQVYGGDSSTVLVFQFDENGFEFVDSSGMRSSDRFSCNRCKHPKPKPKPKPGSSSGSSSGGSSANNSTDYEEYRVLEEVTAESYRQLLPHALPPPPQPEPPVHKSEIVFVLHDETGQGWFDATSEGSSYYIISAKDSEVVSEGTLCDENLMRETCAADLVDGDYYFRVTGSVSAADDSGIFWMFCNQKGFARQELSFSIIDGDCYPGLLRDAEVIRTSPLSTKISIAGHLLIENVFGFSITADDTAIFEEGLLNYLSSANVSAFDVMVTATCQSQTGKFCSEEASTATSMGSRKLVPAKPKPIADGTSTYDVTFLISVLTEKLHVDGSRYTEVVKLSKSIGQKITEGVLSGAVQRYIQSAGKSSATVAYVHVKREEPFKLVHISYVSTPAPTITPVLPDEDTSMNAEVLSADILVKVIDNSDMQYMFLFSIFGLPVIVLVSFLAYRSYRKDDVLVTKTAQTSVPKGGWEQVVFNNSLEQPASPIRQAPRALDSELVSGRNNLPYPGDTNKHSSKRESGSSMSIDALLEIPGRTKRTEGNSSINNVISSRPLSVAENIASGSAGSGRLPAVVPQRDRFRIREGLDHQDISMSSIRSGLSEDKVVL